MLRLTNKVPVSGDKVSRGCCTPDEARLLGKKRHPVKVKHELVGRQDALHGRRISFYGLYLMGLKRLRFKVHPIFADGKPG